MTTTSGFNLKTSVLKSGYSFSKSANFSAQEIINRSSPVYTYRNSNAINISVNLELVAHDAAEWNAQKIASLQKALIGLTFPQKSGTLPPPLCYLTFGSGVIFSRYTCLLTSASCTSGAEGVYDKQGDAFSGSASLSFVGIELMAQDLEKFTKGASKTFTNLSFEENSSGPGILAGGEGTGSNVA